jgi:plasmid stabilization system protein ParE
VSLFGDSLRFFAMRPRFFAGLSIRLTASAQDDPAEILHCVAREQQSPLKADSLIDAVNERFDLLASQLLAGETVDHLRDNTQRPIVKRRFLNFLSSEP